MPLVNCPVYFSAGIHNSRNGKCIAARDEKIYYHEVSADNCARICTAGDSDVPLMGVCDAWNIRLNI